MKNVGNNGRNTLNRFIKQKAVLTFITLIFSLASAGYSWSVENGTPYDQSPEKRIAKYSKLVSQVKEKGRMRVIVGLKTAFTPEGNIRITQEVNAQRVRISQTQDNLITSLAMFNVKEVKKFNNYIPFMAMEVDETALLTLTTNNIVGSIDEDKLAQAMLTDSIPLIGADNAWTAGFSGTGWTVAILDTGVDATHDMLSGKVVEEACYSSNYPSDGISSLCPNGQSSQTGSGSGINCTITEGCAHGSHVAGIAAGKNYGVAKDANIIAMQVFSRVDDPASCGTDLVPCIRTLDSDTISALGRVFELRNTYKIAAANLSLGAGKYLTYCDAENTAYKAAIDNLRSVGVATIISSGNSGYIDSISSPACISTAVSVGAITKQDTVWDYSNSASILHLLAPGSEITSAMPGNLYGTMSGTSQAAPHVAGAWAILKQQKTNSTVGEILSLFQSTGKPIIDARNYLIKPRIQVDSALNASGSCAAILSSDFQFLYVPVVNFGGTNYWASLQYMPTSDGMIWAALINAGLATLTNCSNPASLLANSNRIHVPAINYGGLSYWADFEYQISQTGALLVKVVNYGQN